MIRLEKEIKKVRDTIKVLPSCPVFWRYSVRSQPNAFSLPFLLDFCLAALFFIRSSRFYPDQKERELKPRGNTEPRRKEKEKKEKQILEQKSHIGLTWWPRVRSLGVGEEFWSSAAPG